MLITPGFAKLPAGIIALIAHRIEDCAFPQSGRNESMGHCCPFLYFRWCLHHHIFGWKKPNECP